MKQEPTEEQRQELYRVFYDYRGGMDDSLDAAIAHWESIRQPDPEEEMRREFSAWRHGIMLTDLEGRIAWEAWKAARKGGV